MPATGHVCTTPLGALNMSSAPTSATCRPDPPQPTSASCRVPPHTRRYLIEKAGVALVPGDAFGSPACIRISYAASMETLGKALDRIAAALAPNNFTRS